ncbi:titin-like isoform X1 [Astyanax mexicanus]|uniref:Titin-like isoform X1 n=1 Tax=Astyanax mexicanus TaxID=7994 RepID=A0A8T2LJ59_ASTMX|nr:titin-like isoform X1 [Astyanax mexicanus]
MTLFVGKQAKLQYVITGSMPMNVVWHKDNIAISPDQHYKVSSEKNKHYLEISQLQQSDQGTYLCKASNSVGTATCSNEIRVIDKPSFVKTFESTSLAVGNPLRLECQVNEDTGVTVTWTRDGKKLHNTMDSKISFEEKVACLEIPKAKIKDTGTYACTAANDAGSSTHSSVVNVQAPSISVTAGDSATLECTVSGSPDLKVKWLRDGKEMTTSRKYKISFKENVACLKILSAERGDSSEYTMANCSLEDSGDYICIHNFIATISLQKFSNTIVADFCILILFLWAFIPSE